MKGSCTTETFVMIFKIACASRLLPGTPLIVAGDLMVSPQYPWQRRALEKCRMRFPALDRAFQWFSTWGKGWQHFRNSPGDSGSQFRV
jgi:hypothetical protein